MSGRPGHPSLQIRMPAEHRTAVAAVAEQRGLSVSQLVREALSRHDPDALWMLDPQAASAAREVAAAATSTARSATTSKPPPRPPRKKRRRR